MGKGKEYTLVEAMKEGETPLGLFDMALGHFDAIHKRLRPDLFSNFVEVFNSRRWWDSIDHEVASLDPQQMNPTLNIDILRQGGADILSIIMSQAFIETDDKTRGHAIIEGLFRFLASVGGPYEELVRRGPETEADFLARYHALYDEYMSETI